MDRFLFFCIFLSMFAVGFSFYAEYGLEQQPCQLCSIQRALYLLILFFSIGCCFFQNSKLITCIQTAALLGIIVAIYHLAITENLIEDRCSHKTKITSIKSYQENILSSKKEQKESCKSTWKPFNIPAPLWSLTLFMAIFGTSFVNRNASTTN